MRSIPLRLKLVVALVLPMMIVAVLVGERVTTATNDRRVASAQEAEAIQLAAVAQFADAIAAEAVAINDVTTTPEELAAHRAVTDEAIDSMRSPDIRPRHPGAPDAADPLRRADERAGHARRRPCRRRTFATSRRSGVRTPRSSTAAIRPTRPGTVSRALIDINQLPGVGHRGVRVRRRRARRRPDDPVAVRLRAGPALPRRSQP